MRTCDALFAVSSTPANNLGNFAFLLVEGAVRKGGGENTPYKTYNGAGHHREGSSWRTSATPRHKHSMKTRSKAGTSTGDGRWYKPCEKHAVKVGVKETFSYTRDYARA